MSGYSFIENWTILYPKGVFVISIAKDIKRLRKQAGLTQMELAERAGVGLRFVRDLEQGKVTVRLDKVNQVLALLGYEARALEIKHDDQATG